MDYLFIYCKYKLIGLMIYITRNINIKLSIGSTDFIPVTYYITSIRYIFLDFLHFILFIIVGFTNLQTTHSNIVHNCVTLLFIPLIMVHGYIDISFQIKTHKYILIFSNLLQYMFIY